MAIRKCFYILAFIFVSLNLSGYAHTLKGDPGVLKAKQLKPVGRYLFNSSGQLELISSAVHFGFSFSGSKCELYLGLNDPNAHSYIQYELDGVYQKRIKIEGSVGEPTVITAAGEGKHTIWIYKTTEASTGAILVEKIVASDIKALTAPVLPMIEFIGNSITCGAAADASEVPCGTGDYHDQHNAYMAYGPRVARALNTNFMLSSVSGIGIYRTWNLDGPSMPQVYEKVDFQVNTSKKWDFGTYSPKVVSIALGTNDFSNGDGKNARKPLDTAVFRSSFVKFIQLVKSKYPKARIAMLSSPMIKGDKRVILQDCLIAIAKKVDALYPGEKPVATFFFEPMDPRGCGSHPSVEDHAIMAEQLTPFFKNLLEK
ncbi:SGNH/GDSL hydrolase family protein [Mucilaginibacter psychrotolerans]|uniref:GDSL family lipase n=1 Tax=Mucilaginibacter psychrotolerans TaxID=1524096 RepID=A0A4Y8S475_9SPHI|nr:SGNH/GDSL hydrolase family protein [Mucilaginibacter psychrotolerans]TFF33370.1 GDSL family lipase [Mucilaginibacter psychrotolerans]